MNNIQKNFKAKGCRGLSLAVGGMVDPLANTQFAGMDRATVAQHTNDPSVLNAAGGETKNRYLDYSPAASNQSYKEPDKISTLDVVKQSAKPAQQFAPQPAAKPVTQPVETSFEQDFKDRNERMSGYTTKLAGMRQNALGLADGGVIPETPDQMMARMAAKYGTTGAVQATPAPAPAPVQAAPAPVQAPPPKPTGFFGGMQQKLGRTGETLKGLGLAEGGIVRGKGGPTDDEVPMTVGGVDVNLSNKEAVLPVKTVHALGGPEAVEELIEETNGKPPVRAGLRQGGEYESGTSGWSLGSGQKPTIHENGGLPAPVVQAGIDKMRSQLAQPAANDAPTDPDTDGRRVYSTPTAPSFVNRGGLTAAVQDVGSVDKQEAMREEAMAASLGAQGKLDPATAVMNARVRNDAGLKDNEALPQGLRMGNTSGVPTATWDSRNDVAGDSIERGKGKLSLGGERVISVAKPDGSYKNISVGDAQYTAKDGSTTSDWSKTQQFAEGTAQAAKEKASLRQLQYENNKFNATSDQITDPGARDAGLRGLAQYDKEAALAVTAADKAADAAYKQGDLKIKGLTAQNTANAQEIAMKKDARDFKASQSAHIAKRTKEMLDTVVPTTGLKDDDLKKAGQKRADFEQAFYSAFKRQPADDNEFNAMAPRMKDQAMLSLAMRDAIQNAGLFNKLGNVGHDMWSSLHAQRPKKVGDNLVFEGGFTIPYKDVIGKNTDLDAAYKARMNAKEEQ